MPQVITLYNGWTRVRFNDDRDLGFHDNLCFVQLPPDFSDAIIPDSFIFDKAGVPAHYRTAVNRWWSGKASAAGA